MPNLHHMHLAANPFRKISNGLQTIESRVNDEKRRQLAVGDEIEFALRDDPNQKFTAKVEELIVRPTFSELFDTNPPAAFGGETKEDLMGIFRYYSKEEEEKYGVVGIRLKRK